MTNLDKMNLIILAVGTADLLDKALEEEHPSLEKTIKRCEILLTALKKHEANLSGSAGNADLSDGSDKSDGAESDDAAEEAGEDRDGEDIRH